MRRLQPLVLTAVVAVLVSFHLFVAHGTPASAGEKAKTPSGGIQWFATWTQATAEAKRTKRPILLIAAAPHCRNVSGMW